MQQSYITSRNNSYVQKYSKLSDKKYRDEYKLFLLEGAKLFEEAVEAGIAIESVLLLENKENIITSRVLEKISDMEIYRNVNLFVLSETAFSKISTEKSPDGVICVAKYLDNLKFYNKIEKKSYANFSNEKIMIFCSLRDPGNVGTVVRSAKAFGFDRVVFSGDSADPYNSRTMRAAMGALLNMNIDYVDDLYSVITAFVDCGRRVFCAELRSNAMSIEEISVSKSDCFIIGNEGHGIPPELSEVCTGSVYIPIASGSESLNAAIAASVIMFVQR